MARQTWVGKVENIILTKENAGSDWAVVRLSNRSQTAPDWFSLELSDRTPTSMATLNLLRDAKATGDSVRIVVDRNNSRTPDWQRALVLAVEAPRLPSGSTKRFI